VSKVPVHMQFRCIHAAPCDAHVPHACALNTNTTHMLFPNSRGWQEVYSWEPPPQTLVVAETHVRALAAAAGQLGLCLTLAAAAAPPAAKPAGQAGKDRGAAAAPPPPFSAQGVAALDASGLLVGDSSCCFAWKRGGGSSSTSKTAVHQLSRHVTDGPLADHLDELTVRLSLTKPPPRPPEPVDAKPPHKTKAPADPKHAAAAAAEAAAAAAALAAQPPEPGAFVPPELAAALNPIVISVAKAKRLPDLPATREQLDSRCEPVSLRVCWPPGAPPSEQRAAAVGPWAPAAAGTRPSGCGGPSTRAAAFGRPVVLLGGEAGGAAGLRQLLREFPLRLEVHDRSSLYEPPEFLIPEAAGGDEDKDSKDGARSNQDGAVCAAASVPLLELANGSARAVAFSVPLLPQSTIRGAASRDWRSRPGNYSEVYLVYVGGGDSLGRPLGTNAFTTQSSTRLHFSTFNSRSPRRALPLNLPLKLPVRRDHQGARAAGGAPEKHGAQPGARTGRHHGSAAASRRRLPRQHRPGPGAAAGRGAGGAAGAAAGGGRLGLAGAAAAVGCGCGGCSFGR
jgi:hypothetical protein